MHKAIKILKSPNDYRDYDYSVLSNDMQLIIVSDSQTESSVCGVRVEAGSFHEPASSPGLAHFLEHMLFLGSEKYPNPNQYDQYMTGNGGNNNAWTEDDYTCYVFEVSNHDRFMEGVDMTLQFFIAPLFKAKYTSKELKAVNSEFETNAADDEWRATRILFTNSCPGSLLRNFHLGNAKTLSAKDTREQLIKFWSEYYSSNLMTVVLYTNKSIEEVKKGCIPILEAVKNKKLPKTRIAPKQPYPFGKAECQKLFLFRSVKDRHNLRVVWFFPNSHNLRVPNILSYFSCFLSNNVEGSLINTLVKENLAVSGFCDYVDAADLFSYMQLDINLTAEGMKSLDRVYQCIGGTMQLLQRPENRQWYYDELRTMNDINFRYEERRDPSTELESIICDLGYPMNENILRGGLYAPFDAELIDEISKYFRLDNMLLLLSSKDIEFTKTHHEEYFDIDYEKRDLTDEEKKHLLFWDQTKIFFPSKNPFIPDTFECTVPYPLTPPSSLYFQSGEDYRLVYYLPMFSVPKCVLILTASYPPLIGERAVDLVYMNIWASYITQECQEIIDYSAVVGNKVSISANRRRLKVEIQGFTSSIVKVIDRLVERMRSCMHLSDQKVFDSLLKFYQKTLDNSYYHGSADEIADSVLTNIVYQDMQGVEGAVTLAREQVSHQGYVAFLQKMYSKLFLEFYFAGYMDRQSVDTTIDKFRSFFKALSPHTVYHPSEQQEERILKVPDHSTLLYHHYLPSEEHLNCALKVGYQMDKNDTTRAYTYILYQFLTEPFFTEFRTEHQLGYHCEVDYQVYKGNYMLTLMVVSNALPTHQISAMITDFLQRQYAVLQSMDEEDFQDILQSSLAALNKMPVNILENATLYYEREVSSHHYDPFHSNLEHTEKVIGKATLSSVLDYYQQNILSTPRRVEVHVVSTEGREGHDRDTLARLSAQDKDRAVLSYTGKREEMYAQGSLPDYYSIGNEQSMKLFQTIGERKDTDMDTERIDREDRQRSRSKGIMKEETLHSK